MLLKKSPWLADEAGIVAVVDVDVPDETPGGSEARPTASADWISLVETLENESLRGRCDDRNDLSRTKAVLQ